jgi:hypothetical protein
LLYRLLVGKRSGAPKRIEVQGAVVGRRRLAKDKELDEEGYQERN